ncbi:hypothetical protein MEQU1_000615 [Malassezia equina]|uniref:VLRF1 domain-containing protein n=1 Tax=Malassezia equina TaxID=1381935 RepID=A0AAF0J2G6_9BASI|nr:hypothetical protein MEQU1_000615 [Malassezia equina]
MSMPQRAPSPARVRPALLQAPLYAFDLPPSLASSLVVRAAEDESPATDAPPTPSSTQPEAAPAVKSIGVPACSLCPGCSTFHSVAEQRSHVRSLWHRFNLVLRQHAARGAQGALEPVTHEQLELMCASLERPDDDEEDMDELSALLQQLDVREGPSDDEAARTVKSVHDALRSPLVWYETPAQAITVLEQTQLGLYRDTLFAAAGGAATVDGTRVPPLQVLAAPRLEVRPGTHGWAGKRVQGTHQVSRTMQMQVLDGAGLVPWLRPDEVAASDDEDGSSSSSETATSEDDDKDLSVAPAPLPPLRLWTFFMMGGGYFAAATIALNVHSAPLSERARARGTKPTRSVLMLAHKTFQRYTTRRKQGGAQSAQDASGRHAKSAGANLRRYGEAQLKADIHDLLNRPAWRELIQRSEHVWVRTSMRAAHGVLWQWPGHATSPLDEKQANGTLSHIPIATQRPTLSEIVRVFWELTRVKVAHLSDAELAAQDEAHRDAIARALRQSAAQHGPAPPPPAPPKAPQVKKDEREARKRARYERLVTMVRKGRLSALTQWLARHEAMLGEDTGTVPPAYEHAAPIDRPLPAWWRAAEARGASQAPMNLLHIAAAADQVDILHYLLVERRADPTLPLSREDGAHRTAYDVCGSKSARAVFRRLMAEQPDWYCWDEMGPGGARVPSALTADMEEAQASKARSRRAAMREKMRERDAKLEAETAGKQAATPAPAPTPPPATTATAPTRGPQRLGGASGPGPDATLSEEMQRRIEREKRARAAEARMLRK